MKNQSYILDLVVFVSGAVVMILELTGSRVLAPYVGGSLPVWTGLIGIILGSLSLGYLFGGKLADSHPSATWLANILLSAAISLAIIPVLGQIILPLVVTFAGDIRLAAALATLLLFSAPSVLLGMVSPFAIRLRLKNVQTSGATAGRLYAVSTIGSISGTFFAGFFLIAFLGSQTIFYVLASSIFLLSLLLMGTSRLKNVFTFLVILGILNLSGLWTAHLFTKAIVDRDTLYNRVLIYDTKNRQTIRTMMIANEHSSAMNLNNDELVYPYTRYYRLVDQFVPNAKTALMIGGGGYSYPKDFIRLHPQAKMDVVEIDPGITQLAEQYFSFRPNKNITIYHEDARTYLNREEKQYDAIFNDAFSTYFSHPFQLSTKEALMHMATMLSPNGVIITNTASAITGEKGKFLRAEYYTYKSVFPHVAIFPVLFPSKGEILQNVIIVASKKPLRLTTTNEEFHSYLATIWKGEIPNDMPILTDDYAPVEYYALKIQE